MEIANLDMTQKTFVLEVHLKVRRIERNKTGKNREADREKGMGKEKKKKEIKRKEKEKKYR